MAPDALRDIVSLHLDRVVERMHAQHDIALDYTPALLNEIVGHCGTYETGARRLIGFIEQRLDAAKQGEIELAEQRSPGDRHGAICRAVCTPCSIDSSATPDVVEQISAFLFPTSRPYASWNGRDSGGSLRGKHSTVSTNG